MQARVCLGCTDPGLRAADVSHASEQPIRILEPSLILHTTEASNPIPACYLYHVQADSLQSRQYRGLS